MHFRESTIRTNKSDLQDAIFGFTQYHRIRGQLFDACLRMDGIPALDLLNLVSEVLHSSPRGGWAHGRCSCVRSVGLGHWGVTFVSTFIPRPRETRGIAITVRDTSQMTSVTEISHVGRILLERDCLRHSKRITFSP